MKTPDIEVRVEAGPPSVEKQFEAVRAEMEYMAGRDESGRWRAPDGFMAHAILEASDRLGSPGYAWLDDIYMEAIDRHPARSAVNWVNLWPRLFNNYMMRTGGITQGRAISAVPYLDALKNDPDVRDGFHRNIDLNVRTNVPDRSSLLKIISLLRDPESPLNILDVGGGQGHNAKKLLYQGGPCHRFPYRHIDVMEPAGDGSGGLTANHLESLIINNLTRQQYLPIGSIVGIDLHNPLSSEDTPESEWRRLWEKSCFYTREHLFDPQRISEYDYWEQTRLDNHHFLQADVTGLDSEQVRKLQPEVEAYDVAYLSYSGYQLRETGLQAAMERLEPLLVSEDGEQKGCIVMTDVAEVDEAGQIRFSDKWHDWTPGTFIYDFAEETPRWRQLLKTKNGRVGMAMLLPEFNRLPLAREYGLRSGTSPLAPTA